jgi:hypothetical protein
MHKIVEVINVKEICFYVHLFVVYLWHPGLYVMAPNGVCCALILGMDCFLTRFRSSDYIS